ncbi:PKD domain-containing protein [Tenacibaculum agarivorans]|uniref:PKD domain-containing protein n=1 Tax=Tenacibaculum agarivorans TaxID=1908389 RepID=UPI00094BC21E|nr:hypothetical protein [Tenacibaculum agarivorans]
MNHVDFTQPGGFPLEQNTLARLQAAYKDELFMVFKKHLGVKEDKNYLLYPASKEEKGWLIIQGNLIPVDAIENPTGFIQMTETHDELVFRSGKKHKVFITRVAEHVDSIPTDVTVFHQFEKQDVYVTYYKLEDLEVITNIPDLGNIYLPLDGSTAMTGDLNLGGHKISALDVQEQQQATIRSKEILIGHTTGKGTVTPSNPLGRVLVDEGATLSINHEADWEYLQLSGNINMPQLPDTVGNDKNPILVDENGVLTRSKGSFVGSIIPGLIALWDQAEIPFGWILCDGYLGRSVNGFTIPDLRNDFFNNVRYIMYVGRYNKYPIVDIKSTKIINDKIDIELPWLLNDPEYITLFGEVSDEDGTVESFNWSYTTVPSGLTCTIEYPDPTNKLELRVSDIQIGVYVFKLSAKDNEGLEWFDEVTLNVTPNQQPTLRVDGNITLKVNKDQDTTATTLTAVVSDDNIPGIKYEWINLSNSKVVGTGKAYTTPQLKIGTYNYKVVITDDRGQSEEQTVTVNVEKNKQPPTAIINVIPRNDYDTSVTLMGDKSKDETNGDSIIEYSWTSNPPISINSNSTPNITVHGLQVGIEYTFTLTVTDSDGQTGSTSTKVKVSPKPNTKPVVKAGLDQSFTKIVENIEYTGSALGSVILYGEITDNETSPEILDATWIQEPGGNTAVIESAKNYKQSRVSSLQEGQYKFKLQVVDGVYTVTSGVLTVNVIRKPELVMTSQEVGLGEFFIIITGVAGKKFTLKGKLNTDKALMTLGTGSTSDSSKEIELTNQQIPTGQIRKTYNVYLSPGTAGNNRDLVKNPLTVSGNITLIVDGKLEDRVNVRHTFDGRF